MDAFGAADLIIGKVNAGTWSMAFTAARGVIPNFESSALASLVCVVVPSALTLDTVMRSGTQKEFSIDIGFAIQATESDVPDLVSLVDDIALYLAAAENRIIGSTSGLGFVSVAVNPLYSQEHLKGGVFLSVLKVVYRDLG